MIEFYLNLILLFNSISKRYKHAKLDFYKLYFHYNANCKLNDSNYAKIIYIYKLLLNIKYYIYFFLNFFRFIN